MIVRCDCVHVAQDRLHGPGKRVANECKGKGLGMMMLRCTVCKKEHIKEQTRPKEGK